MAGKSIHADTRLKPRHQDDIRQKIQSAHLVRRLQMHVNGEVELSPSQVAAAKILLDKSVANAPTKQEVSGPDGGAIPHALRVEFVGSTAAADG